ncbi:hypothetical protein ACH50O_11645 [Methylomonas sp. 2BW1-5-20]|uniref:hypothetical protein n=1 Tax=Methylomonas sp. 2BW1-5-20 TaxID=3376686 RepID=UPI0040516EC5
MATPKADKAATTEKTVRELPAPDAPKSPALEGEIITSSEAAPTVITEQPTIEREPMADTPSAAPALVGENTTEATEGAFIAGTDTKDSAFPTTDGTNESEKDLHASNLLEDEGGNGGPAPSVLFVYWPNIAVLSPNGGFAFDENGTSQLTEWQAAWIAEQIAAGNLPEPPEHSLPADPVDYIAMVRGEPQFDDGPTTADVHPDELANWLAAGWELSPHPKAEGG